MKRFARWAGMPLRFIVAMLLSIVILPIAFLFDVLSINDHGDYNQYKYWVIDISSYVWRE